MQFINLEKIILINIVLSFIHFLLTFMTPFLNDSVSFQKILQK
jgi:hypothetical protein